MLPRDLGLEHEEPVWPISDTNRAARHQEEHLSVMLGIFWKKHSWRIGGQKS